MSLMLQISMVANYFEPLADGAIGGASKTLNSKRQMAILDQSKTVAECALQLVYASKEGGGNPKAGHTHGAIDEAADSMKEMLQELIQTLEEAASAAGFTTSMIDTISKALSKTDEKLLAGQHSYVEFQTNMVRLAKRVARLSQDMVSEVAQAKGNNVAHTNN